MLDIASKGALASILSSSWYTQGDVLADTGLQIYLAANSTYYLHAGASAEVSSAELIDVQLTFAGTDPYVSQLFYNFPQAASTGLIPVNSRTSTGATSEEIHIWGVIRTSSGGLLSLQIAKYAQTTATKLYVTAGSHLVATPISATVV